MWSSHVTVDVCNLEGKAGLRTPAPLEEGLAPHLVGCAGQPVDAISDLVETICGLLDVAGGPVDLCCRCLHRHTVSFRHNCKPDKWARFSQILVAKSVSFVNGFITIPSEDPPRCSTGMQRLLREAVDDSAPNLHGSGGGGQAPRDDLPRRKAMLWRRTAAHGRHGSAAIWVVLLLLVVVLVLVVVLLLLLLIAVARLAAAALVLLLRVVAVRVALVGTAAVAVAVSCRRPLREQVRHAADPGVAPDRPGLGGGLQLARPCGLGKGSREVCIVGTSQMISKGPCLLDWGTQVETHACRDQATAQAGSVLMPALPQISECVAKAAGLHRII